MTITSKILKKLIKLCYAASVELYIESTPGIGKTHIFHTAAKELGIELISRRAPNIDVIECRGLPILPKGNNTETKWCRPDWLPTKGKGLLFLDELPATVRSVQATLYEMFECSPDGKRVVAGHEIPVGWLPCAAGNPTTAKAVSFGLSSALISRMAIVDMVSDHKAWLDWAMGYNQGANINFETPETFERIMPEAIAFIRFKPSALNVFQSTNADKPYACERTWEKFSRLFQVLQFNREKLSTEDFNELLTISGDSLLGEGVRIDFEGFLDCYKELPSKEEIEKSPATAKLPTSLGGKHAVCGMLIKNATAKNFGNFLTYVERLNYKELEVMFAKDCILTHRKEIINSKAFEAWRLRNRDMVFDND